VEFEPAQNYLEHKAGHTRDGNGQRGIPRRGSLPHPRPRESDNSPSPSKPTLAGEVSSPAPPPLGESIPDGDLVHGSAAPGSHGIDEEKEKRRSIRESCRTQTSAPSRPVEGAATVQHHPLGRRPALVPS
jgi:hypothetical protein